MRPDQVEITMLINAPRERVWPLLTEADQIARWYAFAGAAVDLRPGGAMAFHWDEHGTFQARIAHIDPPRLFSYQYAITAPDEPPRPGNATLVTFTLSPEGDQTRLRVVEQGFAGLTVAPTEREHLAAASEEAWTAGLGLLREQAEAGLAATLIRSVSDRASGHLAGGAA